MSKIVYGQNDKAAKLLGKRPDGQPIDSPYELGYQCPLCKITYDDMLQWSEYKGFLWCESCNLDYPTPLCVPLTGKKAAERATDVFLEIIKEAK